MLLSSLQDWAVSVRGPELLLLLVFVVGCNLFLGWLREPTRKFSLPWFFYIHASIPFIIVLRGRMGFSWRVIPFTVATAILGQVLGARARRQGKNILSDGARE
jgi:hypothetical protein